jgi:hypothetical protein
MRFWDCSRLVVAKSKLSSASLLCCCSLHIDSRDGALPLLLPAAALLPPFLEPQQHCIAILPSLARGLGRLKFNALVDNRSARIPLSPFQICYQRHSFLLNEVLPSECMLLSTILAWGWQYQQSACRFLAHGSTTGV